MLTFAFVLWCCVFCLSLNRVLAFKSSFNADELVVEGQSMNSSDLKFMLANRNVSKINVYLTHTFYADEDLKLHGIRELQVFTSTWHNTRPIKFDLSGVDGASQVSAINGSAGRNGNAGMDGGNFFGVANKTINGDYLTVISNGGNGGDGQDGGESDDIYVLLGVNDDNNGDSGWFSNGDLHSYYKKYFDDRGYDSEITDIDDYTSLYAVFVHDKTASFDIRLHPRKCCGTTGIGGAGGLGGWNGKLLFKHVGNIYETAESVPIFSSNNGSVGNRGKDGRTCESLALDVRIVAELKKVVFIALPLHHSFSSKFTVISHTNSSKCSSEFVRNNETIVSSDRIERNELETLYSVIRYKKFLIESMKNASLSIIAEKTYIALDANNNWNFSNKNTLKGLVLEACELEKNYFDLKNAIHVVPMYEHLSKKIGSLKSKRLDKDSRSGLSHLQSSLRFKLNDLKRESRLITNLELYSHTAIQTIELRNQSHAVITNINDVDIQNNLNELQSGVDGNFMLTEYNDVIDGFKLTFFPFAVDYLENYKISTSPSAYNHLDDIVSTTTTNLGTLTRTIREINSNNAEIMMQKNSIDNTNPTDAFFIWKSSEVRAEVRKLFEGKSITLLADVKESENRFMAAKFNTLELVFRSTDQRVNDYLNHALKAFEINLNHTGLSTFQCGNNFYQLVTDPVLISFSFEKGSSQIPVSRNGVFTKLRDSQPMLSPYTLWEIYLNELNSRYRNFEELSQYGEYEFDVELHGTGTYIAEEASICENGNLAKFYTQI